MSRLPEAISSLAGAAALVARCLWQPATGLPTCSGQARGRRASTLAMSIAVGALAYASVRHLVVARGA